MDATGSMADAGIGETSDLAARAASAAFTRRAESSGVRDRESTNVITTNRRTTTVTTPKTSVPPPRRWSQDGRSSGFCHATRGASQRRQRSRLALMRVPHDAQTTNPTSSWSNIEGLEEPRGCHVTPGQDAHSCKTDVEPIALRELSAAPSSGITQGCVCRSCANRQPP